MSPWVFIQINNFSKLPAPGSNHWHLDYEASTLPNSMVDSLGSISYKIWKRTKMLQILIKGQKVTKSEQWPQCHKFWTKVKKVTKSEQMSIKILHHSFHGNSSYISKGCRSNYQRSSHSDADTALKQKLAFTCFYQTWLLSNYLENRCKLQQ